MSEFGKSSFFVVVVLALCLILTAGCSSSGDGNAGDRFSGSAVQEGDAASQIQQVVEDAGYSKNDLAEIQAQLEAIAGAWSVSDVSCNENSCTAEVSNENGNTAVINVYLFLSPSDAMEKFEEEKNAYSGFKMVTPSIPQADDAFVWVEKTESKGGAVKANVVAIVDVTVPGGVKIAGGASDITEAQELLQQVAAVL